MASGTVHGKVGTSFPFAAVVGQPKVKRALECALVSKRIGSVLLMGPAGTAKTTMVRALDGLVPDVKIINLPLNATEEQIVGGLDLEAALKDGRKEALPGLLQRASGNILYVDDINLLSERLIYDIMEVALRKQSIVEREGISLCQECDFLLIGTMDPEEGMLSQHLLDRFDLCVSMSRLDDVEERMEILRRGLSYEFDPILFSNRYQESMDKMRDDIKKAQEKAQCVFIPNGLLDMIARLCQDLGVQGHRGDIALAKTAMSIAALNDRDQVILSDLEEAAPLCLEHRRHDSSDPKPPEPPKNRPDESNEDNDQKHDPGPQAQDDQPKDSPSPPAPPQKNQERSPDEDQIFDIGRSFVAIDYMPQSRGRMETSKGSGRRDVITTMDGSGRYTTFRKPHGHVQDLALDATIRAAAPYQRSRHRDGLAIVLEPSDLLEKVRKRKRGSSILFLVDASGSMGAHQRMTMVKGAILALLKDAYQKRDEVGMMAFRKDNAELLLPLTRSVNLAYDKLERLPTGGKTPLALGLTKGFECLTRRSYNGQKSKPTMVVITDGKANMPMSCGDPFTEALEVARRMAESSLRFVVVDTGTGFPYIDRALRLSQALGGTYFRLEQLDSRCLTRSLRATI